MRRTTFLGSTIRRLAAITAIGTMLAVVVPSVSIAAGPGFINRNYGTKGYASSLAGGDAIVVQPNGKTVSVGGTGAFTGDFSLARYNTDGQLDTSFGTGGIVNTSFGPTADWANAVALQSDGKIIAAGEAGQGLGYQLFALARYNTDGSLDTSFGTGGMVTTPVVPAQSQHQDVIEGIAIQSNGKIVAVGYTSGSDFALARYNTDGSLDTSFGDAGTIRGTGLMTDGAAYAVAIQPDGKILAAGGEETSDTLVIARFDADGDPDPSFDVDGQVGTEIAGLGRDIARAIAVREDGKIVVAGCSDCYTGGGGGTQMIALRYLADGTLDSSFGTAGVTSVAYGVWGTEAEDMALQPDGSIVAVGCTECNSEPQMIVVRLTPDGAMDSSFGVGGRATIPYFNPNYDYTLAHGVDVSDNGKHIFVAAGAFYEGWIVFRYGTGLNCTIYGSVADDVLTGTSRADRICGFGGDDSISGNGGADRLIGGLGTDVLLGGAGADTLDGIDAAPGDQLDGGSHPVSASDVCLADPGDVLSNC